MRRRIQLFVGARIAESVLLLNKETPLNIAFSLAPDPAA
jgi:hypothetical protein